LFLSEALAIGSATCIAMSALLFGELKGRVALLRLVRWQMLAALALTGAVSLALGGWRGLLPWQLGLLAASSFCAVVIGSTTYFAAIFAAGPRNTALLFSLTAPFALVLGYLFLGETIGQRQGLGIALVLAGIVLAIGMPKAEAGREAPTSWSRTLPAGIVFGAVTAFFQALGNLLARPAMAAGVEPFTAMAVRSAFAAVVFIAIALVARALPIKAALRPYRFAWRDLSVAVVASFIGAGLGMSLLMAALARGQVGVVSTLASMTPVMILPLVWLRTGTAPPPRAWIGAALAVAGTGAISL
jgi:drug/metabolite transporter (DMT)-like permease